MLIKILYCGICHSDLHQTKNEWKNTVYPCLPGYLFYSIHNALQFCRHEIVGIVTEVGGNVGKFKVGDKAGVGCLVGSCHSYGGFSDKIVVDQHFVVKIPENLPMDRTAPLLCAGITVYSPMKNFELDEPGKHLGVIGLGGLGHVAVKFGKAFGMKAAIGTMDGIIDTVSAKHDLAPLISLLKTKGKLVMVGAPEHPLELHVGPLLFGAKTITGSLIGGIKDTQEMIDFAGEHNITAEIELVGADYVNEAMKRLAKADVRYRFVIDIGNTLSSV